MLRWRGNVTRTLTDQELQTYEKDGLLFPIRVFSPEEAAQFLSKWEAFEHSSGSVVQGKFRYKSHLLFPFVDQIMREPAILDLVEDILGPDIMVWNVNLYPKEPGDGRFISWHQDSAHWGLDNNRIVSVWVALSPATRENGCMRMIRGSHRLGTVPHIDTWDPANILTRGQTIAQPLGEETATSIVLNPGECSLHHVQMKHSSPPNHSKERRVALAVRYITPSTRQQHHDIDFATLVRGEDAHGHFMSERRPSANMEPEAITFHEKVAKSQGKIFLHGTERAGIQGLAETSSFATR